uniref:Protein COFACTOR ASSEMBLY OF COMPLEX C SUBUNIT B CCB2, chloroplastic n=1 Tax=Cucumis melo TaxID=3656 RepID=A0A9I9CQA5_CUCME
MISSIPSPSPLNQLTSALPFRAKSKMKAPAISARLDDSKNSANQQLNLSVLRFTLGIPGLDESYLPRWIGYGFGSLLLLNHFVGSNSAALTTPAQLRTEALGISLAAFSIALPYLGKFLKVTYYYITVLRIYFLFYLLENFRMSGKRVRIRGDLKLLVCVVLITVTVPFSAVQVGSDDGKSILKGAVPSGEATLPEGTEQIFLLSQIVSDNLKEDIAWATYILLRNTNSISVTQGALCVRGYWNSPNDISSADLLAWFEEQLQSIGLSALKDAVYFPQISEVYFLFSPGAHEKYLRNNNTTGENNERPFVVHVYWRTLRGKRLEDWNK